MCSVCGETVEWGRGEANMISRCMTLSKKSINQNSSGWPPNPRYKVLSAPRKEEEI